MIRRKHHKRLAWHRRKREPNAAWKLHLPDQARDGLGHAMARQHIIRQIVDQTSQDRFEVIGGLDDDEHRKTTELLSESSCSGEAMSMRVTGPVSYEDNMFGPSEGTWWVAPQKDPRWNGHGRAVCLASAGIPQDAKEYVTTKAVELGPPPVDLQVGFMKD